MRDSSLYHDVENPWALKQRLYVPWSGEPDFEQYAALARPYTLVTVDRLYVLYSLVKQSLALDGSFVECGVYKGGTARLIAALISGRELHLFDTFEGMPDTDPWHDRHAAGDFADTSVEAVMDLMPAGVWAHKGYIPQTFPGRLPDRIAFAHIDVDIYRSVMDCCEWIYPRIERGGFMVFDDYGGFDTPGCADAVDEYFAEKPEVPLVLGTGQAVIFKM